MSHYSNGRAREWRAIPSYPGYEASDHGEIRSWIPWKGTSLPRMLNKHHNSDGYEIVRPKSPTGHNVTVTVHLLVAEAFLGPRPGDKQVCHWNGVPDDNSVENLRYDTKANNSRDSIRHGTHFPARLTVCKRGHALEGANLYVGPTSGKRMCRACRRLRTKGLAK